LAPANKVEHDEMIRTRVKAGIRQSEAEQLISLRKNAYNKGCKDYKSYQIRLSSKTKRSSKQFKKSQDAHDN
jgi:hypothetical protein